MEIPPLSLEEENAWSRLVEEGRTIREPRMKEKLERRQANAEKAAAEGMINGCKRKTKDRLSESMVDVPVAVKRWVVSRAAGISFRKAGEVSGASWLEVMDAKAHSEEFRCALFAQEARSRELMRAKAQSIVEQSQDEGTRVSMAQTQVSMKILESLDRSHFGDVPTRNGGDDGQKALGNGGFVVHLIQDASSIAQEAPKDRPRKALVFADV